MPSTERAKVYLIEPADRDHTNVPILDELRQGGLEARFHPSPEAMLAAGDDLEAAEVLITNACSKALMDRAPALSAIINPYTGSERIDREAARARSIIIGHGGTPENFISMAEATVLLLLHCFYSLPEAETTFREHRTRPVTTGARMLYGKTIGVIGYGAIGQAVVHRLAPWGLSLLVSAPRLPAPLPPEATQVALEELLRRSDGVLVLCSLNPETANLLNRERLSLMKRGSILVNTARGGIIDEPALADLARDGHIRKIALDAFQVEPLPPESPLRTLSNAILTPHMVGHTKEGDESLARRASESVRRVLAGQPPVKIFNPEVLDDWLARRRAPAA